MNHMKIINNENTMKPIMNNVKMNNNEKKIESSNEPCKDY